MWVTVLSLLACNPSEALEDDIDVMTTDVPSLPEGARPLLTRADPDATWPDQRVDKRAAPSTELIQTDCYGSGGNRRGGGFGSGAAGPSGGAPPRAAETTSRPRPRPSPKPRPSRAPMGDSATSAPAATPSQPAALGNDPADGSARDAAAAPAPEPPRRQAEEKKAERSEDADREANAMDELAPAEPRSSVEWGATVYLSNDDSMSLASAQRLLWAVDQGRSFSAGEVRPHELLNYFSFDTVPVIEGELFSVLGGAEQNGDILSVALAVQGAKPARQPLDLTLVIDRSGSMRAEGRMAYVKKGLTAMTDQLVDGDRIDLTLFDSRVCSPVQSFVVGRDDPAILQSAIDRMQPRGSTDLDGGLREGYRIQSSRDAGDIHKRNRRILLLTDAFLNSGNVNEALVSEIGKQFDENGIRVTGVGVGREFNDKMLDRITEKGKGAYVYLGSEAVVDRVFGSGFDSLVQTIAHDVRFSIDLPDSLAMERFYGEEASTNAADVQPIHYYAGTSQLFLQDLKIKPGALAPNDPVKLKVTYRDAVTGEPEEQVFQTTVGLLLEGDRHNLDKAQALMKWTDLLAMRAMGDRSCDGLRGYRRAASQVQGDAEIAYVSGLTGKLCGVDMSQTVAATGVAFKVKVDADLPIPEVVLDCQGEVLKDQLSGSDTVARFDDVVPGTCSLVLQGNVPMRASVEVPSTGGDVRCLVRGGRMSCQ